MSGRARGAALLIALAPAGAAAYSTPALYPADPVRTGGGGGRVFSGSPTDSYTCEVCHTGGPAPVPQLRGRPPADYEPGATYMVEMTWPEEHLAVVVEAADAAGAPLGTLRLPPDPLVEEEERCAGGGRAARRIELADGREAIGLGDCGARMLRFQWTAPDEVVPGALHVAAVAADADETPAGDGAAHWTLEVGPQARASGCAVDRGGPGWLVALLVLAWRRRAALLVLLVLGTGCTRVQPYQRGRLAQPDMELAPDPDLSAGPEHALDYREGSAGGLGGGGGGCGCN